MKKIKLHKQKQLFGAYGSGTSSIGESDTVSSSDTVSMTTLPTVVITATVSNSDQSTDSDFESFETDSDWSSAFSDLEDGIDQRDQDLGWTWDEFLAYYEGADGEPVTLHQVGHFDTIRDSETFNGIMERANEQIEDALANFISENGITEDSSMNLGYEFINSYDFTDTVWAIGGATVSGVLDFVTVTFESNGDISWDSSIYLTFHDVFEDPVDIWDIMPGTFDYSDPFIINESWTENLGGVLNP